MSRMLKVGDVLKDKKRDLVILEIKKKNRGVKHCKYHCNKCGYEGWSSEYNLRVGVKGNPTICNGCNRYVGLSKAKEYYGYNIEISNTIYCTDPWVIKLGVSEEDAKKYTRGSVKSIKVKCPNCGAIKYARIDNIINRKSIGCVCKSGTYPEKIMYNMLEQLNLMIYKEYQPKWSLNKRYDFYIPSLNMIIETHGIQHYEETTRGRSLAEEEKNDRLKRELAKNNGVDYYITIDCRYSKLEYIKQNILKSKLNKIFNLNNIDWNKCEEFAIFNNL